MAQFTWNGATFEVRPLTVGDALAVDILVDRLGALAQTTTAQQRYSVIMFGEFVVSTRVSSGVYSIPTPDAEADELLDAYQVWIGSDADLIAEWKAARRAVSAEKKLTPTPSSKASTKQRKSAQASE